MPCARTHAQKAAENRLAMAVPMANDGDDRRPPGRRIVGAAARLRVRAVRRPAADQVQVGRQAPRRDRLEHVVLEHEVLGVRPVIRDLPRVVITHHIRRPGGQADAGGGNGGAAATVAGLLRGPDEPVHLAAVDVRDGGTALMHRAAVHQAGIVVRPVAALGARIGHAHREPAVPDRNAVGARVGAEERIERPVLLHDDHDMPDLVDPAAAAAAAAAAADLDPSSCPGQLRTGRERALK